MLRDFFLFQLSSNQSWEPSVIGPRKTKGRKKGAGNRFRSRDLPGGLRQKKLLTAEGNCFIAWNSRLCSGFLLRFARRSSHTATPLSSRAIRKWCLWLLFCAQSRHTLAGTVSFEISRVKLESRRSTISFSEMRKVFPRKKFFCRHKSIKLM
jgi:hypothetical protein